MSILKIGKELKGSTVEIFTSIPIFYESYTEKGPDSKKEGASYIETNSWVNGLNGKVFEVQDESITLHCIERSKLHEWVISKNHIVAIHYVKKSKLGEKQSLRMKERHEKKRELKKNS